MRIFDGVPRGGASNNSGVIDNSKLRQAKTFRLRGLENNCAKTNKHRPILLSIKNVGQWFWQYKLFVDIRMLFSENCHQTRVGGSRLKSTNLQFSRCYILISFASVYCAGGDELEWSSISNFSLNAASFLRYLDMWPIVMNTLNGFLMTQRRVIERHVWVMGMSVNCTIS